jgi:Outer membrane protein beta-barrel domain
VVGVGAEYAFWNNWSAKVEYNHFDFGGDSGTFIIGNTVTLNTVKAGINYRFGGPGGPWPFCLSSRWDARSGRGPASMTPPAERAEAA